MERAARCLHCSVLPSHSLEGADNFVNDLREAVETVKASDVTLLVRYYCVVAG